MCARPRLCGSGRHPPGVNVCAHPPNDVRALDKLALSPLSREALTGVVAIVVEQSVREDPP